tara:strand:+ start:1797 stop:2933 length:1137 start_codon:yes stop_codon:yes gene_type:complete
MGQNIKKKTLKKKIIIFMPSIEGGGVEKNLFIVTNHLATKIKNLYLISISKKYKKKFHKSVNFITLNSNFWDNFGRKMKYILSIFLLIKLFLKDRKVIVFAFQANIYCVIVCKIFFVKVITRSNTAPIGWSNNILKRFLFKFFLNLSDKIIVNSVEFKKNLKKELSLESDCIYNPLNFSEIIKKSKSKSKKIFTNNKLKILNIGRLTNQKDQITILKALNIIKKKINFEMIIVGRGILKEELLNFIRLNNLTKKVKIMDFVENPFPLIKQSDLFILSSKYEGLPNVLLEALVLKKFIISSNCRTGPKEILINGKGGLLFKIGNYTQLAKQIIYFNKNKATCKKLLKKSTKALYRFDYKTNLEKYFQLVKSIDAKSQEY